MDAVKMTARLRTPSYSVPASPVVLLFITISQIRGGKPQCCLMISVWQQRETFVCTYGNTFIITLTIHLKRNYNMYYCNV